MSEIKLRVEYQKVIRREVETDAIIDVEDFTRFILEDHTIDEALDFSESGLFGFLETYLEYDFMNCDPETFEYNHSEVMELFKEVISLLEEYKKKRKKVSKNKDRPAATYYAAVTLPEGPEEIAQLPWGHKEKEEYDNDSLERRVEFLEAILEGLDIYTRVYTSYH